MFVRPLRRRQALPETRQRSLEFRPILLPCEDNKIVSGFSFRDSRSLFSHVESTRIA